jgi:hypothetical protein
VFLSTVSCLPPSAFAGGVVELLVRESSPASRSRCRRIPGALSERAQPSFAPPPARGRPLKKADGSAHVIIRNGEAINLMESAPFINAESAVAAEQSSCELRLTRLGPLHAVPDQGARELRPRRPAGARQVEGTRLALATRRGTRCAGDRRR